MLLRHELETGVGPPVGRSVLVILLCLWLSSCCGDHLGPVAENAQELRRVPEDSAWIRARGISNADVGELSRFQKLEGLDLHGGYKATPQRLTASGFEALSRLELPALRSITVSCSDLISDEALTHVANIETVDAVGLVRCGPFGVEGLRALADAERLTVLNIRGCTQIGDEAVDQLVRMHSLEKLYVAGTGLSDEGIERLKEGLGDEVVDNDIERWRLLDPGPRNPGYREHRDR